MLCALKHVSARLCQLPTSRSFLCCSHRYEYSPFLSICLQERKFSVSIKTFKESSQSSSEDSASRESGLPRLTAKWTWVVRGQYKVAAFSADNNPATAINNRPDKHWHIHKCANCQTVYEHTHPYRSLHHPQHIKDCPVCQKIAPADLEIS